MNNRSESYLKNYSKDFLKVGRAKSRSTIKTFLLWKSV